MTNSKTDEVVEVVRARRFELVDHAGRVLAVLEARDEIGGEGGSLTLRDADGHERVLLTGFEGGGEVFLPRACGNLATVLSANDGLQVR